MTHSAHRAPFGIVLFSLVAALASAGCASAPMPVRTAHFAAAPVHFEARRDESRESPLLAHESRAAAAKGESPAPIYPPEVVHEARIELAREALDADNQAKAEAEEAEQMQRDIASARTDDTMATGHDRAR